MTEAIEFWPVVQQLGRPPQPVVIREDIIYLGAHVGHLFPTGQVAIIVDLSKADKKYIEVACAQHQGRDQSKESIDVNAKVTDGE